MLINLESVVAHEVSRLRAKGYECAVYPFVLRAPELIDLGNDVLVGAWNMGKAGGGLLSQSYTLQAGDRAVGSVQTVVIRRHLLSTRTVLENASRLPGQLYQGGIGEFFRIHPYRGGRTT